MEATTLGIDLAKNVFHVHGADVRGRTVFSKRVSRRKLVELIATLPSCLIGMEACGSSHYWARRFHAMGHTVRLISPQFVKPYVKSNKNDRNDAEAICEAVSRPTMRFVAIKSVAQQDRQALHRVRQRLIGQRTALINQIRGLLAEYGIVVARQPASLRRRLPEILEDAENDLSGQARALFAQLYDELRQLQRRINPVDEAIKAIAGEDEICRRLQAVEGVGPLTATALTAAVGDARAFKNGRQFAAYLGLVPRQYSSGDKLRLGSISKRGDTYLRTLLIHGARNVVRWAAHRDTPRASWIRSLVQRCGAQKAAVAVANKNARVLWVLMARGECY
ncbi:MAG: IS110 family transposase, partial [Chloroflexota bacterium]